MYYNKEEQYNPYSIYLKLAFPTLLILHIFDKEIC